MATTTAPLASEVIGETMNLEEVFNELDIFAGENVLGKIMRHLDEHGSITKEQAVEMVEKATKRRYE